MKTFGILMIVSLMFCGCATVATKAPAQVSGEQEIAAMQRTCEFLKEAKAYYIATVDKDQPHVRPFGTIHIFENRLYVQTGRHKNVARQLLANGKVELCALKGDEWIRVSGVLVDDGRREAKVSMLEDYKGLQSMYSPDDPNTMVLYFQPGSVTATIWSFSRDPIVLKF